MITANNSQINIIRSHNSIKVDFMPSRRRGGRGTKVYGWEWWFVGWSSPKLDGGRGMFFESYEQGVGLGREGGWVKGGM